MKRAIGYGLLPRESNSGVPVNIQDQTSKMLDLRFIRDKGNSTTVKTNATAGSRTIDLTDTTGYVDGNIVGIFSPLTTEFYFGQQIGVPSGDTITLDTPLDYAYLSGATVINADANMAVDGSVTTQVFQIGPVGVGTGVEVDITKVIGTISDNLAMDDSKFGGIAALTNGVVLRKNNGRFLNYGNAKSNGDLALFAGRSNEYTDKAGGGNYSVFFELKFAGPENHGVTVRLRPGEILEILIQDDLTDLLGFYGIAQGHIVEDYNMANPVSVDIIVGEWVKVATSTIQGAVTPLVTDVEYVQTYRMAGDTAPVNGDYEDAVELPTEGIPVAAAEAIDVYVAVYGDKGGKVRVDL